MNHDERCTHLTLATAQDYSGTSKQHALTVFLALQGWRPVPAYQSCVGLYRESDRRSICVHMGSVYTDFISPNWRVPEDGPAWPRYSELAHLARLIQERGL